MTLPKAIQDQIEHADQIVAQLNGEAPAPADTPPQEEPQPTEPAPEVVVPKAEPAPVTTPPQPDVWETKYNVLQGKYNAEVPRLSQQVRELMQANQKLAEDMEALKTQRTTADQNSLVTDADKEAFGSDLVDLAERVARKNLLPLQQELAQLKEENNRLMQQVERTGHDVASTAMEAYTMNLTRLVPNWQDVNVDQGFLTWLGQIDPVFGVERQAALDRSLERMDATATAAVFNAYLASLPQARKPDPKDELQRQVAPNRSRSAAAPVADDWSQKHWTEQEIHQFYMDQRRGVYSPAEADRISNEIDRAVAEGRIRM
jgi:FtsZ-binding cell division protein ZapB